jgi:hypothetical protein
MTSLTRTGYVLEGTPDIKKELKVKPIVNTDYGGGFVTSFNLFRPAKGTRMCVPRFWAEEKFGLAETDKRPPPATMNVPFVGTLRKETHQIEAFDKAVAKGHGVLSLPCGYGKTTVALAIASKLGYRTMIIVHKEFLAVQWAERIEQFCPGAKIGRVQRDRIDIEGTDFTIAMLQTLSQKEYTFEQFESIGTVIIDEAHHICAQVFSQSMFKVCPKHIYGLSATPNRKDGLTKVLNWFVGDVFFAVERTQQEHVEVFPIDFDCPLYRTLPPVNRADKISLVQMITDLVEHDGRNKVICDLIKPILKTTRHVLVLSDRRAHCMYLHGQFPGVSGLYMGGMKREQLEESSRKQLIIATFSQAHEGLDIPSLDTVILVTPKSDIIQSIGRIMRETAGKRHNPHIYDMRDSWSVLFAMYNKRKRVYMNGGFKINGDVVKSEPKRKFLFNLKT